MPPSGSHNTHLSIPALNIIYGINTNIKIPHNHKDFNPMQKMCCEKLVNCTLYFLDTRAITGDTQKVLCPELACILKSISNVILLLSGEILDLTENGIVL